MIAKHKQCLTEPRTRFSVTAIERDCPARQCLHRAPGIGKAGRLEDGRRMHVSRGETPIPSRKGRVEVDRLLKEFLRERVVAGGGFAHMPQPALIGGPSVEIAGRLAHGALLLGLAMAGAIAIVTASVM